MPHYALISEGYGAGWSTWITEDECPARYSLFYKPLIEALLAHDDDTDSHAFKVALEQFEAEYPDAYTGGAEGLTVVDTKGMPFRVTEYDGYESIEYADRTNWYFAPEWEDQ